MYNGPITGAATGTGMGTLAATGSNLSWWIFLGMIMLIAGLLMLHAAQRRIRVKLDSGQQDG